VGDENRSPRLEQHLERREDFRLALGVERRRRLVEDENRRIAQERPRDGDSLPPPT
jgi:hypothetical protein